jgi:hypothetical protein
MSGIQLVKGKWRIYGNEEEGELDISGIDSNGNVTGTAFGDKISNGSFSVSSGEITFIARMKLDTWQLYTGYISKIRTKLDISDYLLAGSYANIVVGKEMSRYGWYATITHSIRP